jgi:hypothetical protein
LSQIAVNRVVFDCEDGTSGGCWCNCDLWTRRQLTGDWLGDRTALADRGIVLDADVLGDSR